MFNEQIYYAFVMNYGELQDKEDFTVQTNGHRYV